MNIFFENQIKSNQYLLNVLFGRKTQTTAVGKKDYISRMDTVTISDTAVSEAKTHGDCFIGILYEISGISADIRGYRIEAE
jgi:hypothetical protein